MVININNPKIQDDLGIMKEKIEYFQNKLPSEIEAVLDKFLNNRKEITKEEFTAAEYAILYSKGLQSVIKKANWVPPV